MCARCSGIAFYVAINTLRPRENGRHFADDMFKCIFLNENVWIPIEISLKFVPKGSINNNPALFQIMAWRRPGDKPLSEPMLVCLLTHICVTRPQWVKSVDNNRWHCSEDRDIKIRYYNSALQPHIFCLSRNGKLAHKMTRDIREMCVFSS